MQTRQLLIVIVVIVLLSAGLGIVITDSSEPGAVDVTVDLDGGAAPDLGRTVEPDAGQMKASISGNERVAILTLRSIAAAQQLFQAAAAIDTDDDGGGEHGYFGELAGRNPLRIRLADAPAIGTTDDLLDPGYLPTTFGNVITDGVNGVVERRGYYYKMFLPDASVVAPIGAQPEAPGGGAVRGALPGSSNAEIMWCCYCWPSQATKTGNRAFFINQAGDVLGTQNRPQQPGGSYDAFVRVPEFDAVFTEAGDMGSAPALAEAGQTSQDGLIWKSVDS